MKKNISLLKKNQVIGQWTVLNSSIILGRISCQCSCKAKVKVRYYDLINGKSKSCTRCCNKKDYLIEKENLIGKTINEWYVIKPVHVKDNWLWLCKCSCGNEKVVRHTDLINGKTKKCHKDKGPSSKNYKGTKEISGTYINRIKKGAKSRSLAFTVTKEDLHNLAEKQKFCCALTGEKLIFPYYRLTADKHNASLDRIDSSKGYIVGNVQWITIDANLGKQQLSQSEFINLCMKVSMNYLKESESTENKNYEEIMSRITSNEKNIQLLHAAMGISTELGEFSDNLKKYLFYGSKLNIVNAREELGDIMWYIALACRSLDVSLEDICEKNINKLKIRYPDKFTNESAENRNIEEETRVLSDGVVNLEVS